MADSSETSSSGASVPEFSIIHRPEPVLEKGLFAAKVIMDLRHSDSHILASTGHNPPIIVVGGTWGGEVVRPYQVSVVSGRCIKQSFENIENAKTWQEDVGQQIIDAVREARARFETQEGLDLTERYRAV